MVELDGHDTHEHRFEADRERDAALLNAGFPVLRVTWHRLKRREMREAERLRGTLAARAPAQ